MAFGSMRAKSVAVFRGLAHNHEGSRPLSLHSCQPLFLRKSLGVVEASFT